MGDSQEVSVPLIDVGAARLPRAQRQRGALVGVHTWEESRPAPVAYLRLRVVSSLAFPNATSPGDQLLDRGPPASWSSASHHSRSLASSGRSMNSTTCRSGRNNATGPTSLSFAGCAALVETRSRWSLAADVRSRPARQSTVYLWRNVNTDPDEGSTNQPAAPLTRAGEPPRQRLYRRSG